MPSIYGFQFGSEEGNTVAVSCRFLELEGLVEGHVYEFDLPGVKSAAGRPLVHTRAYYTVNEIPKP